MIILGRDGVINCYRKGGVKTPDEWVPVPGSVEAISHLNRLGHKVVIASNQPGLSCGSPDINTLNRIHEKMHRALAQAGGHIDGIFFCPHNDEAQCHCRKPETGLFDEIERRFHIDFHKAWVIGDSIADMEAARTVGAQAVLVRSARKYGTGKDSPVLASVLRYENLACFVKAITGATTT